MIKAGGVTGNYAMVTLFRKPNHLGPVFRKVVKSNKVLTLC